MERTALEVPAELLRKACDPDDLDFETTEELAPLEGTVGQDRGLSALEFGLQVRTDGYNIFVAGVNGAGRNTTVRAHLHHLARTKEAPVDWCYVYNFAEPHRAKAISLPTGTAPQFAQDVDQLVGDCRRDIPKAFGSEEYEAKRARLGRALQDQREVVLREIREEAARRGFALEMTQAGVVTIPLIDGKPAAQEQFDALSDAAKAQLDAAAEELREEITQAVARAQQPQKEVMEQARLLDREVAFAAVGHHFEELARDYAGSSEVLDHLRALQIDMVEHVDAFRQQEKPPEGATGQPSGAPFEDPFGRYAVNVFVTNRSEGAPIVIEHNPTYYNLCGRIDYRAHMGTMFADFSTIKAGAIHRANGGYLVLQARDLLLNPLAWDALKRVLRSHEARVENIAEQLSPLPSATLKPEPIPIAVKVIVIGHPSIYYLLYNQDEEFRKLFKVKADFGTDMERSQEHVAKYAAFVASRCRDAGLKHFHRSAVAKVIEHGSRLLEHQSKLSTRFIDIADLVDEASFWAEREAAAHVMARHVDRAIEQKEYRSNLVEERLGEMITDGTVMIDTAGAVVGQINGLSILDMGDYSFGKPSRITARTYLGSSGVTNIERDARMSGRLHSKGVMILSGYLSGKYAQDRPLSLGASLTFEQLYDDVDGDSASSAELYALLSSLADLPVKQSLAVTGSINQRGEIQAIGGVTRKIEGFFKVCKARGLTGEHGVLIPSANVQHLMLSEDVIRAVRASLFHIYSVRTVDEGIELLTGVAAGQLGADGTYPPGTVHHLVAQKLASNAEKLRGFGRNGHRANGGETTKEADGQPEAV